MTKSDRPTISVAQLLRLLEESGFEVRLTSEKSLLKAAAQAAGRVRALAAVAQAVKIKGLIVPDDYRILINRSLGLEERVQTMIHELIHLQAPELSEAATERQAQAIYRGLTPNQLGQLEFLVS